LPDKIELSTSRNIATKITPLEIYLALRVNSEQITSTEIKHHTLGALSLEEGAATIRDLVRTKRFMLAIEKAVHQVGESRNDLISVVDAGCGPLPILSITAALTDPRVRCTAIELNPNSAKVARDLVNKLGLSKQINVVEGDATTINLGFKADIIASETMDTALFNEPIAQILGNLSKFIAPDGFIIPERIDVLALLAPEGLTESEFFYKIRDNTHLAHKYDWSKPSASFSWNTREPLDLVTMEMSPDKLINGRRPEVGYFMVLASRVHILQDLKLEPGDVKNRIAPDSLISLPKTVDAVDSAWFIANDELDQVTRHQDPNIRISYKPGDPYRGVVKVPSGIRLAYI